MHRTRRLYAAAASAVLTLFLCAASETGAAAVSFLGKPKAEPAESVRKTPSGLEVPRYVSLKFGEVNARAGPGDDYKTLFTYRVRGLPLQVIAETADWRRVCDPEGAVSWVHQRTVDNLRRTVMRTAAEAMPMRRRPDANAPVAALLAGRAIASLGQCKNDWCQLTVGRTKGWAPAAEVWGTSDEPQCHPRLPRPSP